MNQREHQQPRLSEILQDSLKSIRSHLMREDFQQFREYRYPVWAGRFLDGWCAHTMRSRIEPMKAMARTFRSNRELILNWFRADGGLSAGFVEGFNDELKLTIRKSDGFRTQKAYEITVYHNLRDLRVPKFIHTFV